MWPPRQGAGVCCILATVVFTLQIAGRSSFYMLSQNRTFTLDPGQSVELSCEFHSTYFNLFDNPVLWIKTQHGENSRVNIMSNINKPFVESERFMVEFDPTPPRYRLSMLIRELSLVDIGNYTCEVRGPETSVLGTITHRLHVRAPVQEILLTDQNCTDMCAGPTADLITFTENEASFLLCKVAGGSPNPDIKVFIEDFDITYRFHKETSIFLSGIQGLRLIHTAVYLRTAKLVLEARDDGKELSCTTEIPGLTDNMTSAYIEVHYAPVITCKNAHVYENDRHAHMTCLIRSKPPANSLYWIVNSNGTIVHETSAEGEFWTLIDRTESLVEAKLYMNRAKPDNFRQYALVAENVVGKTTQHVELQRRHRDSGKRNKHTSYRQGGQQSGSGSDISSAVNTRHLASQSVIVMILHALVSVSVL